MCKKNSEIKINSNLNIKYKIARKKWNVKKWVVNSKDVSIFNISLGFYHEIREKYFWN